MDKKYIITLISLTVFSFIIGTVFYPQMPDKIDAHWNLKGEVDGVMPKFWGIFLLPLIFLCLTILFILIPYIDPLKSNIKKFKKHYQIFVLFVFLFMLLIYFQMILWNLNIKINFNLTIPLGLTFLFFYTGILCENAKPNWFVGIRTPWTLSNKNVWNKTHKIAGKLFKIVSLPVFLSVFFTKYILFLVFIPLIAISIFLIVYSYWAYKNEMK